MRRLSFTIVWVMQLWSTASPAVTADHAIGATVVWPGGEATLTPDQAALIAKRVVALFGGCSLESRSNPSIFQERSREKDWATAIKAPRVHVTWAEAVSVRRQSGYVSLNEAVVPLSVTAPYWFSRHDESVVMWTKCRWPEIAAILCDPLVLPHLHAEARKQCVALKGGGAVEQPDAADEVRDGKAARPSPLIWVFDGPNPSALRYGREADG
jgi:hypothetical protein